MRLAQFAVLALVALALAGPAAAQRNRAQPPAAAAPAASPFADWTAIVAAGDFRAHSGAPAETFDNARRDLAAAFIRFGIRPENLSQFSVRPDNYPDPKPLAVIPPQVLRDEMQRQTARATGGCLLYFTSHGNPDGILYGNVQISPQTMKRLVDESCGTRPTVVFMSACFSGVYVPALAAPNRFIMTAARPDRSSFGCGESNVYTFFDTCVLETLPKAPTFDALATEVLACVVKAEAVLREEATADLTKACAARVREMGLPADRVADCFAANAPNGVIPPSEPQVSIGETIRPMLASLTLQPPSTGPARPDRRGR